MVSRYEVRKEMRSNNMERKDRGVSASKCVFGRKMEGWGKQHEHGHRTIKMTN